MKKRVGTTMERGIMILGRGIWLSVDPLAEQTMEPYLYAGNNPVRFTDPTGMSKDDWVKTNGNMVYDSRVTDQKSAIEHYGNEAEYYAPGTKYESVNNTSIELGYGGHFKEDGMIKRAADNAPAIYDTPLDGSSGITAASAFTGYGQFSQYSNTLGIWRGKDGKIYNGLKGRGPNGATRSRGYAQAQAGRIGIAGNALGIFGMYLTDKQFQYDLSQNPGPNLQNYLERRNYRDQTFNASGFFGPYGAAASFGYNLGYLIEDVCNCNIQINPYTLDFTPVEQTLTDFDNAGINVN